MSGVIGFSLSQYADHAVVIRGLKALAEGLRCRNRRGYSIAVLVQRLGMAALTHAEAMAVALNNYIQPPVMHDQPAQQQNVSVRVAMDHMTSIRTGLDRLAHMMVRDSVRLNRSNLIEYLGTACADPDNLHEIVVGLMPFFDHHMQGGERDV